MVVRTFLDKCTTIVKDSEDNFGLNPVAMLNYGKMVSRFLVHFDIENIKDNGMFGDNVRHVLKMTNCASIDDRTFNFFVPSSDTNHIKKRAVSFDIFALKVPNRWDEGVGFDDSSDIWLRGDSAVSIEGCNWYQCQSGLEWGEYGIYSIDQINAEYLKYINGKDSNIIGICHFDHGNENLELDVTDYVNKVNRKELKNNGIMLCFAPSLEEMDKEYTQYVGFFTNNTNTFFEPFVESRSSECIIDNRHSFYIGRTNRLYLYANVIGEPIDLDDMPVCTIDGKEYDVKRLRKGVYYCEVKLTDKDLVGSILYDTWSNLSYNGDIIDDVEQDFVVLSNSKMYSMTASIGDDTNYSATIIGIDDREKIISDDVRLVKVEFKRKYDTKSTFVFNNVQYRLYVMNGKKEHDVIAWDNVDMAYDNNFFMLDTNTLVPNDYYIDIRLEVGGQVKVFKGKVKFTIVSNCTKIRK